MTTFQLAFGTFMFLTAVPALLVVMGYFAREAVQESRIAKFLSVEEMETARKYASMFGLDNNMEIDLESILEMGRKYEEYLGAEKIQEIHQAIVEQTTERYFFQSPKSNGKYHRLSIMMKASVLVAVSHINSFFATLTKALGGDKNGEPTSN